MAENKDVEVAVSEVVDYLKINGRFSPALMEVVVRKMTVDAAKAKNIQVTDAELQSAADTFRLLNGLNKAEDTEGWLAQNGISVDTFENYLETNVLISKFKAALHQEAEKENYVALPGIQEAIGDMVYQDWVANVARDIA